MRLGFLTERMLTGFGVDLVVDRLAAGLGERGHEVTVYASVEDGTYRGRPYRIRPVPVRASKNFPLMQRNAMRWAGLVDDEYLDAVEVHTFPFFGLIPRMRTPTVAVDYGVSPTEGMPAWLRADFAYIRQRTYGAQMPRATRVLSISDFLRRQMPTGLREKTEVVHLGSDHYHRDLSAGERQAFRRANGIPDDAIVSLYVGRLNHAGQPYKGVAELLEHFRGLRARHPGAVLLCVGFGDVADANEVRRAGGIAILKAPAAEMPVIYGASDILVTCSRWEGFGLPFLEGQRAGLAALAYNVGAHPEICRAGESALLVDSADAFYEAWESLLEQPDLRSRLGSAGAALAAGFSWDRAVDAHEAALAEAASTAAPARRVSLPAAPPGPARVSVVVLTYHPDPETLARCLDSVAASDYPGVETVVVDNGSGDGVAERLTAGRPGMVFLPLPANLGFSVGINRGIEASAGSLVFILNPDTEIEPDTISHLVDAARRRPDAVGFAPKMLFMHDRELIDGVGTAIDPEGAAFNRGIGQLDVGQFDIEEPVMGACFGATLVRREAFLPHRVGPLDENFFLYYEDVDWCVRATLLGEDFWTVPSARVYHVHSATTREQAYAFKYRLIERNLLFTVFKSFEQRRTVRIHVKRTRSHLVNIARRRFPLATVKLLAGAATGPVRYWGFRTSLQRRRVRSDIDLFKLTYGESPHFDPVNYSPTYGWATIEAMIKRLWLVTGEERWERAHRYITTVMDSPFRFRPLDTLDGLERIAAPLPPAVVRFFEHMAAQPGMLGQRLSVAPELVAAVEPGDAARTA
jgi:GT2 family glycosyltransferase/glycosyltransferase involved in cell wall biosynthesis